MKRIKYKQKFNINKLLILFAVIQFFFNGLLQAKNLTDEINDTTVHLIQIEGAGLIYVSKESSFLKFWSLDANNLFYKYLGEHDISTYLSGQLIITLNGNPDGLFYSDNLFTNSNLKIKFKSNMIDGKIAIPIDYADFMILSTIVDNIDNEFYVDSNNDLKLLAEKKAKIYNKVEITKLQMLQFKNNFKDLIISQIIKNYEYSLQSNANSKNLLENTEQQLLELQEFLNSTMNNDVNTIEQAGNNVEALVNNTINQEQQINTCLNNGFANSNEITAQLSNELIITPPNLQAIEGAQNELKQIANNMIECIPNVDEISSVEFPNINNYLVYENRVNSFADSLKHSQETVRLWEDDFDIKGAQQLADLNVDMLTQQLIDFENQFLPFVSQQFRILNESSIAGNIINKNPIKQEFKQQEVLCQNFTTFIEFELGDVNVVIGTPWDDGIKTAEKNDLVISLNGNDCIETHAGYDFVLSGRGNDTIYLGDDHDFAFSGAGIDEVHGSAGNEYEIEIKKVKFKIAVGNFIIGGADDDFLYGGEVLADKGENDTLEEFGFADLIIGDGFLFSNSIAGEDTIQGEMGIDFLIGSQRDDDISNIVGGVIKVETEDVSVNVPMGSFFWGNLGNDIINGSNTTNILLGIGDFIWGNQGDDLINANDGKDFVSGGIGDDLITGGRGRDIIFGQNGIDTINGDRGIDIILAGDGDDVVFGGRGFDLIFGSDGNDMIQGGRGADIINGGNGEDNIQGNRGLDFISGGAGNDNIQGNEFSDIIKGGTGEDTLIGNDGWDFIFGNEDTDQLFGNDGFDLIVGGGNTNATDEENIEGGNGTDIIWGNSGIDVIEGNNGLDVIQGDDISNILAGNDIINGGGGIDFITGNNGNDLIRGNDGLDVIWGNGGTDFIDGENGPDLIFGNDGCDFLNGNDSIDFIFGGAGVDTMRGNEGMDFMYGGMGQDIMFGDGGIDVILGGLGVDFIDGGNDIDVLNGGDGDDHIVGGENSDLLFDSQGNDFLDGQNGSDILIDVLGNNSLLGNAGNDILLGGFGNDRLMAGDGFDFLFGFSGNDRLLAARGTNFAFGGPGNDVMDGFAPTIDARDFLFGGDGDDTLRGNIILQTDVLSGGLGSDDLNWTGPLLVFPAEFDEGWDPVPCNG